MFGLILNVEDCPGITYLTMEEIYRKISTLDDKICEVGISYLEVYNETVRDLLSPAGQFEPVKSDNILNCWSAGVLEIRETGNSTAIPGLTMHKPTGPEGILSLLTFGKFSLL